MTTPAPPTADEEDRLYPRHLTKPLTVTYPIVGMTNSGSLLTPVGQRVVIAFRRV